MTSAYEADRALVAATAAYEANPSPVTRAAFDSAVAAVEDLS